MSEAQFYLTLFEVIYKRRFGLKHLSIGLSEGTSPSVMLEFQKTGLFKLDDDSSNLKSYIEWFEKVKHATERIKY